MHGLNLCVLIRNLLGKIGNFKCNCLLFHNKIKIKKGIVIQILSVYPSIFILLLSNMRTYCDIWPDMQIIILLQRIFLA